MKFVNLFKTLVAPSASANDQLAKPIRVGRLDVYVGHYGAALVLTRIAMRHIAIAIVELRESAVGYFRK